MPNPALEIHQLTVNYDKTPVLWDLSFSVPPGNLVGIIGPNGAGKTTLIKTALGLLKPLSGKISFFGQSLQKMRQKIAYIPQRESVDWDFPITVEELVLMGCYGKLGLVRLPGRKERSAVKECLELVGMEAFANRQISQLSGGQQQRVFLARALLQKADIYFLDEPFAGIDMASTSMIMDVLRREVKEGKTLFVVHHDLNTVENTFDWVVMLNLRLIANGPVSETFTREVITKTYGKSYTLLDQALKLAGEKEIGNIS